MQRLIGVFDLAFLLLGTLAICVVMLSPVYRVLSINIPKAPGGVGVSPKDEVKIAVSPHMISFGEQKFNDLASFRQYLETVDLQKTKVILSVDSTVAFSRLAKVLGILKIFGINEISFEVKEEKQ